MKALELIAKRFEPELEALQAFLREQIFSLEEPIRPLARYCLETQGKRLRPLLVFVCSGAESKAQSVVESAAIVELVHVATLVHDDILDGANIRHNRPTLDQYSSTQAAVLLGDALFSHALQLAASFPSAWVCKTVAQAVRRVCAGEIQQTLGNPVKNVDQYKQIVGLKTGELFELSATLGAYWSQVHPQQARMFSAFGFHLGVAYQMLDDILDIWGQESQLGKTLGTDVATGKQTLPFLVDVASSQPEHRLQASLDFFFKETQRAQAAIEFFKNTPQIALMQEIINALEQAPTSLLSPNLTR